MGKKVCYTLFLTVCLLLAVSVSAFAAEVPVVELPEIAPAVLHTENEPTLSLFSGAMEWDEDSTCYRDQLVEYCKAQQAAAQEAENQLAASEGREPEQITLDENLVYIYDDLVKAFKADNLDTETEQGYWLTPELGGAKVFEIADYIEYGIEAWSTELINAVSTWFNEYVTQFWLVADAFAKDHPEYFWIRGDVGFCTLKDQWIYLEGDEALEDGEGRIYPNQYVVKLVCGFSALPGCGDRASRDALQKSIDVVVANLMEQTEELPDAQKIAYWDNWLAQNNTYNTEAAKQSAANRYYPTTENSFPWSVVSAFLPVDQPVCEGYAKAMQLLCKKVTVKVGNMQIADPIPCVQITGIACGDLEKDPQVWEPHMWTAIKLEGSWYFCDPTWDDPVNLEDGTDWNYSFRDYLLRDCPNSHQASSEKLGVPKLSKTPYFAIENEETVADGWIVTDENVLTGFEAGSGAMMIVLYDENGKMLDLGFCEKSIQWGENEWLYLAPTFEAADLAQATRIVRINVGDMTAWSPLQMLKAIRQPVPAE